MVDSKDKPKSARDRMVLDTSAAARYMERGRFEKAQKQANKLKVKPVALAVNKTLKG